MTDAATRGEIIAESAVRFVRPLAAAPQRVWDFLTDTDRMPEWHGQGTIEPREGGGVSLMDGHIRGVVTRWSPCHFLAYSWNVHQPGETGSAFPPSYVEIALEAAADGTRLTLVHRPIPQAMHDRTAMGWHTMLDLLEARLGGQQLKRSDAFSRSAALYGVDMSGLKR